MNNFEKAIAGYIGEENLKKIQAVRVGIAGAGGLGSNCAACLVRSGFRRFLIVDFDRVELSNLNRQFYFEDQVGDSKVEALKANLLRINRDVEIEAVCRKLESPDIMAVFGECDIVVEAFDAAEYKSKLIAALMNTGKFVVSASGISGYGDTDGIRVRNLKKGLVLVGDLSSDTAQKPPLSPGVSVAAAKQADAVLAYVLGTG
ncbi:MAG: sulfur carrier protein ThiS adenylyltransferase ThiF [Candidatus Omnitrophica bacterium]|nr:sulfur carrier protein ThiS adenylyltransferase ThiF [Candidatus Omnitrophota bacterium]